MDIELLRNFLEIARLGSMTKAASSLHISQPTLSVQMKSLEEVLGRKLFRKEGRNLVMTEEGELLERRAADIIGLTDKTLSEFRALSDSLGGDVRIGCAESVLIDHLALAVKKIKKKRPFLRCFFQSHITSGDTAIVTSILEQGLIDFAIIVEPPDLDRYDSIRIPGVDTWCAVIPEDSPLAAKKSLTFDYIKNEPIIMSKQSFLADLPRWCGSRRNELTIFGYLNLFYNGTRFVKNHMAILLTFAGLAESGNGLAVRPLSPVLSNRMYIVWKKRQIFSPAARDLLEILRENAEKEPVNE